MVISGYVIACFLFNTEPVSEIVGKVNKIKAYVSCLYSKCVLISPLALNTHTHKSELKVYLNQTRVVIVGTVER